MLSTSYPPTARSSSSSMLGLPTCLSTPATNMSPRVAPAPKGSPHPTTHTPTPMAATRLAILARNMTHPRLTPITPKMSRRHHSEGWRSRSEPESCKIFGTEYIPSLLWHAHGRSCVFDACCLPTLYSYVVINLSRQTNKAISG